MSDFIVSARKYRPSTFGSVVGQRSTTATLKNAIRTEHLAQAYLFCGPRGVGKTTCARIFAKTINCSNLSTETEPCNECESCKSFNENRSYNIHELDAASNNSVDDIRNLIEQVRIPPQISKYSVYIIDEVHMLSQAAFNAFLKTLEEPPKHAIFILATTEKHKILPTILSRCQIYDFNRIQIKDTVEFLSEIAEKENIEYEPEAFNIIAQKADGAMRDALSVFDQVVSFSNGKVSYQEVIDNLNILDYEYFFSITDSFLSSDVSKCLILFDEILNKGFDAHNFISGLNRHFRDLLVCKAESTVQLLEVGDSIKEKYLEQASRCDSNYIFEALEICNDTDLSYRASKNQRLHIELALVKICNRSGEKKNDLSDVLYLVGDEDQNQSQNTITSGNSSSRVASVKETPMPVRAKVEKTPSFKETLSRIDSIGKTGERSVQKNSSDNTEETSKKLQNPFDQAKLDDCWTVFVEKLKKKDIRMYSALKSIQPQLADNHVVELSFQNNSQLEEFQTRLKPSLTSELWDSLKNEYVEVVGNVVNSEKLNRPTLLNDKERLEQMIAKNPALLNLKNKFKLDFE